MKNASSKGNWRRPNNSHFPTQSLTAKGQFTVTQNFLEPSLVVKRNFILPLSLFYPTIQSLTLFSIFLLKIHIELSRFSFFSGKISLCIIGKLNLIRKSIRNCLFWVCQDWSILMESVGAVNFHQKIWDGFFSEKLF